MLLWLAIACGPEVLPTDAEPAELEVAWTWDPTDGHLLKVYESDIDVDLDGYDDVLVQVSGNDLLIWHGAAVADDAWVESTGLNTTDGVVAVGDLDGDGLGDIALPFRAREGVDARIEFHRGTGSGFELLDTLTPVFDLPAFVWARPVPVGDTDGDGRDDLVVAGVVDRTDDYSNYDEEGWEYRRTSTGWAAGAHWLGDDSGPWIWSAAGDVNGDGYRDLASVEFLDVRVYPGGPNGLTTAPIGGWTASVRILGPAGDVNGDGYGDILTEHWSLPSVDAAVELHLGGPEGPSEPTERSFEALVGATNYLGALSAPTDLDGDSYDDVVLSTYRLPDSDDGGVFVYRGGPGGPAEEPDASWIVPGGLDVAVMVGDVNGDGRGDFVLNDTVRLGG